MAEITIQAVKRQMTNWEIHFQFQIQKGLISLIYKESLQIGKETSQ